MEPDVGGTLMSDVWTALVCATVRRGGPQRLALVCQGKKKKGRIRGNGLRGPSSR